MNYIKIDHSNINHAPENYVFSLELTDNNNFIYGVGMSKNEQEHNILESDKIFNALWEWLENKGLKFSDYEVEKYKISQVEFESARQMAVLNERRKK